MPNEKSNMLKTNETDNLSMFRSWVFLGTSEIAVYFLDYLYREYNISPALIITNPSKPQGRKQVLTPSPVYVYAQKHNIPTEQTTTPEDIIDRLKLYDFFVVFAYGSLLDTQVLNASAYGVFNIHPSLLPQYRGPSPITTAILKDTKETAVTLMKLNEGMDTGPIIAQQKWQIDEWKKYYVHEQEAAQIGVELFINYLPLYLQGKLKAQEQDGRQASYCPKYKKSDMEIDLSLDEYSKYRIYCAFDRPFFINNKRYLITQAHLNSEGIFVIDKVIPEGKRERDFQDSDLL